jgi:small-conductance mechanosensitive channel
MEKAEAGGKVDRKGVEEIKAALKDEQGKARDLRADKAALQSQNERLHETESELRERVLLLGHELERSQRAQGAPVELEVNKYRATLRLVWDMTPPEDREWFLKEVAD